ncbi:pyridoxal-phosphate dependent enzyme [Aequorivita sp. KMM 9714]|uniref:pyridoxal-phosphate dependent enzyme n=1 Tax=Aequorivita sp. KMM 9714 TaxID=2707173 RepID=UPI0013ED7549|nr:pyridoxal-phosphate dependent enzyme [Aequorivita sp. KMM 9714]NGX84590.1 pyridoxal-phosphate dependent enzyme [Aequorivita sp. KMM 9714]
MIPSQREVEEAYERVKPYVHNTPVLKSSFLNELSGAEIYFKCENFQRMGAFKMRGAVNAILQLSEAQKRAGVVTHSSGNFAQALSLAAKNLGVKAYIVMPKNAPQVKKEAVKGYGGIITESESTPIAREQEAERIQNETAATFIHPSNDKNVILGNAISALELLKTHQNLDYLFAPVGGGGLIAGTSVAVKYFGKNCNTIGGEPFEVDDAFRSLQTGKIEFNETTNTIADGLKTSLGDVNFPIIKNLVSEIIRVEETEIISAMKLIWERLKIVVEPSSAVALAALLRERERFQKKKIGIIISGGNVDLKNLPF